MPDGPGPHGGGPESAPDPLRGWRRGEEAGGQCSALASASCCWSQERSPWVVEAPHLLCGVLMGSLPLLRALASPRSSRGSRAGPTGLGVIQPTPREEGSVCLGDPEGRGSHHGTHRDWASLEASTHSSTCKRGFLGAAPHLPPGAHLVLGARPPAPRARFAHLADAAASVFLRRNVGSWY